MGGTEKETRVNKGKDIHPIVDNAVQGGGSTTQFGSDILENITNKHIDFLISAAYFHADDENENVINLILENIDFALMNYELSPEHVENANRDISIDFPLTCMLEDYFISQYKEIFRTYKDKEKKATLSECSERIKQIFGKIRDEKKRVNIIFEAVKSTLKHKDYASTHSKIKEILEKYFLIPECQRKMIANALITNFPIPVHLINFMNSRINPEKKLKIPRESLIILCLEIQTHLISEGNSVADSSIDTFFQLPEFIKKPLIREKLNKMFAANDDFLFVHDDKDLNRISNEFINVFWKWYKANFPLEDMQKIKKSLEAANISFFKVILDVEENDNKKSIIFFSVSETGVKLEAMLELFLAYYYNNIDLDTGASLFLIRSDGSASGKTSTTMLFYLASRNPDEIRSMTTVKSSPSLFHKAGYKFPFKNCAELPLIGFLSELFRSNPNLRVASASNAFLSGKTYVPEKDGPSQRPLCDNCKQKKAFFMKQLELAILIGFSKPKLNDEERPLLKPSESAIDENLNSGGSVLSHSAGCVSVIQSEKNPLAQFFEGGTPFTTCDSHYAINCRLKQIYLTNMQLLHDARVAAARKSCSISVTEANNAREALNTAINTDSTSSLEKFVASIKKIDKSASAAVKAEASARVLVTIARTEALRFNEVTAAEKTVSPLKKIDSISTEKNDSTVDSGAETYSKHNAGKA